MVDADRGDASGAAGEARDAVRHSAAPAGASPYPTEERCQRHQENVVCEDLAEREGDRLLKTGDERGGMACLKVAALIRKRRDALLLPF